MAAVLEASKSSSGAGFANLLFLVVIVVGFYLLFMRPARARQRKAAQTRNNVEPGVEVVTTGGVIGHVVETDDETVTLEIAPGVPVKFLKQSIARVVLPPEAPVEPAEADVPDDASPGTSPDTPSTPQS